jgi:hypothetical protein
MLDTPASFDADSTRHFLVRPLQRYVIRIAMVTALGVYAAYLAYRGLYTINVDALSFSLAVYAAEIHGFVSLFLLMVVYPMKMKLGKSKLKILEKWWSIC